MATTITTERLLLNTLGIEDNEFILQLVNTRGWLQFIGNRNVHTKEDASDYINKIIKAPNTHYWVVRLKNVKEPIGVVTFIKRSYLEYFDIGFAFMPAYNGKGYAYEAAKAVLSSISAQPEHSVVLATTLPANVSSIKLLTKLGLHFEKVIEAEGEHLYVYTTAIPRT